MKITTLLRSQVIAAVALTLLLALLVPALMGQSSGTSGLTGTVTDPSGAAVPNVTVTLTSNATAQVRTATTGGDGAYKFSLLPPGDYKIRFAASGFKTAEVGSVILNVTETPALDRTLEVGAQTDQITVEAAAEAAPNGEFHARDGGQLQGHQRCALRQSQLYANSGSGGRREHPALNNAAAFGKGTLDMSVNGAASEQNNFQMDGVSVINAFGAGTGERLRHLRRHRHPQPGCDSGI